MLFFDFINDFKNFNKQELSVIYDGYSELHHLSTKVIKLFIFFFDGSTIQSIFQDNCWMFKTM
jgi:hypothetical protein